MIFFKRKCHSQDLASGLGPDVSAAVEAVAGGQDSPLAVDHMEQEFGTDHQDLGERGSVPGQALRPMMEETVVGGERVAAVPETHQAAVPWVHTAVVLHELVVELLQKKGVVALQMKKVADLPLEEGVYSLPMMKVVVGHQVH